ncbi:MAG: hypothetical protein U9R56_05260 [candidate division Zixibacteria bacterium]|nr:hypothetical protein [candidate division Zixibacteria bacterium]
MENNVAVKTYVEDLFRYLDTYEREYSKFEAEAFLQTYNGICAVFQALCRQRDNAVEVDQTFLSRIKHTPLTSSDLRQITIQVLITFFESEADIDGQSNSAYSYCRGLRAIKQDVPFFENHLIPLLFQDGSFNNNHRLNSFFLREMARYFNTFGKPLQTGISPEAFAALSDPLKFLELMRRRLQLGNDLLQDRTSLEFHLQRIDAFNKLKQKKTSAEAYLRKWGYLKESSFWSRVKTVASVLTSKVKGVFSNWRYFRLVITQRNPAMVLYSLVIVVFILLAVYVPLKWVDYSNSRYDDLSNRAKELVDPTGK